MSRDTNSASGPLDGITVLAASRVLSAPFCTMQLGDLGADVVKVERPGTGDQTRGWHPPTYGDSEESAYYVSINRNKRSLTLDLASDEGQALFRELAAKADVVVENFRVGTMERWGLGYDDLRDENPDLIYCSLTGYGESGPHKDRPAYDLVVQAEAGLMSITGPSGGAPVRVGVAIADIGAGMYATQGILAALLERELSGGGQKVEVSLFEGLVAWQTYMASNYFATGESPGRMGSKHPTIAPYQAFETQDDYAVIAVPSESLWLKFCDALDREDLRDDDRFATNADRVSNRTELDAILVEEIREYETDAIVELMRRYGVPASAVNDMEAVFDHPQVRAREMRTAVSHPTAGSVDVIDSPMNFSRSAASVRHHPPLLGEHTAEILREFGYTDDEIAALREDGII